MAEFEGRASQRHSNFIEKLSIPDREKIACALLLEIERLESNPELCTSAFSKKALALRAGLAAEHEPTPTKRLHELTMDPGEVIFIKRQKIALYAKYENYKKLIKAILEFSKEDRGEICMRIFSGTSFEGVETDINSLRAIERELNKKIISVGKILKIIDRTAGLEDVFKKIKDLKEIAQKNGSIINWPFYDLDSPYSDGSEELPNWNNPYWPKSYTWYFNSEISDVRSGVFYPMPLDWYGAILHLPRVYLGCAIYFEDWDVDPNADTEKLNEYFSEIDISRKEIAEIRLLNERRSSIAWVDLGSGSLRENPMPSVVEERNFPLLEGEGHCWLAIYPHPSTNGVCPILYWNQGEGGVHVCVINAESIHALSRLFVSSETENKRIISVFDRVRELLDSSALEIEWARTAFDLLSNPFSQCSAKK